MASLATVASLAGAAISAVGTIAAGQAQKRAANYEADQLDVKAKEERASAQRDAQQYARQKRLALSRIQTLSGAGGFTGTDPTVAHLAGETEAYGTLQEQMAMYGGEARAEGLKAQGAGLRMSGKAAVTGSLWKAGSTIIGGVASMYDRYGRPNYPNVSTAGKLRYGS